MTKRKNFQQDAEEVQTEGVKHLSTELGKSLNNPETSDVIFLCKDERKLHACRWLLSIRCQVFKGMFGHEMLESKLVEIPLLHFSSEVLLVVFEYLYTGAIKYHLPLNWKMGFEIISAARFFMIPAVEVIAQEFMWNEVAKIDKESRRDLLVNMLNEALEFQEAWEGMDAILEEVVGSLGVKWFEVEDCCSRRLSVNSVEYILSRRQGGRDKGSEHQSMEEYITFRHVVLWQACQTFPKSNKEVEVKLQRALPIEEDEATLWSTIFKFPLKTDEHGYTSSNASASDSHNPAAVLNSRFGTDIRKDSLQRLLVHIDWSRIPAMLLLKIVSPLEVASPAVIFEALAFQALHKPVDHFQHVVYKCKSVGSLTCDSAGQLDCRSGNQSRSAWGRGVVSLPMPRSYGTYEWEFEILENDADFITVGIISGFDNDPWKEHGLQQRSLFSCPATRLLCIHCGKGITYVSDKEPKLHNWEHWEKFFVEPEKNSPLKFKLNASEKTCHVSYGDSFATVWRDLPEAVYHPVVGMMQSEDASIQIKTVSGFHYV